MSDRLYGHDQSVSARIQQHMQRAGITREQRATDPQLHYTERMLRSVLTIVEMALHEEDVDPKVIDRVVRTVIYGAVPTEADVQDRIDRTQQMVELAKWATPPMLIPKEPR